MRNQAQNAIQPDTFLMETGSEAVGWTRRCFCSAVGLRTSLATWCLNECEVYVGARLFLELCQGKGPCAQVLLSHVCPEHMPQCGHSSSYRMPGSDSDLSVPPSHSRDKSSLLCHWLATYTDAPTVAWQPGGTRPSG